MAELVPHMAKLYFVSDGKEPMKVWNECKKVQDDWSKGKVNVKHLKNLQKKLAAECIFESNKLEDTLPPGTDEAKVKKILIEAYDVDMSEADWDQEGTDDIPGGRQLRQHMEAFKLLCLPQKGSNALHDLSEELIQQAHFIMMRGLKTEQGMRVSAGVYRKICVHAGQHVYPSYECIPENMKKIVSEYNQKASQPHDMYQLASWLHFKVVSLHPFEDGNGRISRLLWCYSLIRDGLPFPAVLTSGHKRSQSHLVHCLQRDRKSIRSNHPHLTTLTVVSVYQAWKACTDYSSSIAETVPCTFM